SLVYDISGLSHTRVMGLMTMGPVVIEPEKLRPYFIETKVLFDKLKKLEIPGIQMKYLSMGMSDSYPVAVEEGANLVRIGSKIFA
ncbi:MAG: YggS family pyridoxal phosphate-dependent enzyme, partial [Dehalococcoidales bacterium]|nr:YggS family pyridoxal phosphate-dependent enzyme [Dehalococcoidales bacterium]